jgi:hypothetical protein
VGRLAGVVADIVFRRLGEPAERSRARRMVGAGGFSSPRLTGSDDWSGLWRLTANDSNALVAVAATARPSPQILEVRAIAAGGDSLWARLLRELTDTGRAHGAEWLVAGVARADAIAADLLRGAGFGGTATDLRLPENGSVVWLALPA